MNNIALPYISNLDYPIGRVADEVEAKIARDLPYVPGLDQAQTKEERVHVLAAHCEAQLARFIKLNGDPFGQTVAPKRAQPIVSKPLALDAAASARA